MSAVKSRACAAAASFLLFLSACSAHHHVSAEATATDTATAIPSASGTIVVFAAASLRSTFSALAQQFEQANPHAKVVTNFGGSDSLAAQIVEGAPVDVFAAANITTMSTVTNAGDAPLPMNFASNELEIAVAPGNPLHITSLADLTKAGVKVALCAKTVPCGAAANLALQAASVTAHPVTLEQNVTGVLTKVELGEVDAGLVYQTDVKAAGGKVTGINFPEAAQAITTYPIAAVTTGQNGSGGQAFAAFVVSAAGEQVLQAAGFRQP